jgi:hypothetical protein
VAAGDAPTSPYPTTPASASDTPAQQTADVSVGEDGNGSVDLPGVPAATIIGLQVIGSPGNAAVESRENGAVILVSGATPNSTVTVVYTAA